MRILVVSGFWPTVSNPVLGIFVVQQVKALCDAGAEVSLIASRYILKRDRHLTPEELGLPTTVRFRSVAVCRLPEALSTTRPALWFNTLVTGIAAAATAERLFPRGEPIDGCIVHSIRYLGVAIPRWAGERNIKTLLVIHGRDSFLSRPTVRNWLRSRIPTLNSALHRWVLVGTVLRKDMEELGADPRRTAVVANGTEIPPVEMPPVGKDGDPLIIVSVSNLIDLKGIDDNLRALQLLRDRHGIGSWRYDIVGSGPERPRLEQLAASLGLGGQVRVLGRLPYQEAMGAVAAADIFSLPSWGEAFGIVYLEAMARFKPTIGCLRNGAADIITDGEDGLLVPPKDPEALAQALKRLVEEAGLRAEIGRRARLTAERFSWDINAVRILELLRLAREEVIDNGKSNEPVHDGDGIDH